MPKRHRRRTMKGGFFDDLSNTLSGWGSSLSEGASSVWQKTKEATSSLTGSTSSNTSSFMPTSTYTSSSSPQMTTSTYGGKHKRSRRRHMRGGFEDNTPITGLAAHAAPFSGPTAEPQTIVGGKTKRRKYRKGGKSRRHRKH
jgi:hypothetical protein